MVTLVECSAMSVTVRLYILDKMVTSYSVKVMQTKVHSSAILNMLPNSDRVPLLAVFVFMANLAFILSIQSSATK